jgi:hypothetical protein
MGKISYNLIQQTMFVNISISLCHYFFCAYFQVNLDHLDEPGIGVNFFSLKSCNYHFLFLESSSPMTILLRSSQPKSKSESIYACTKMF